MAFNEDLVVLNNNEIECILCEVRLPDEMEFISSHINDEIHQAMYKKRLMIRNNISFCKSKILCFICEDVISDESEIETHVKSTCHESLIRSITNVVEKDGTFLELPEEITHRGSDVHCLICNDAVSFTLGEIKCHLLSTKHKRARSIALQPFNGIFSVEGTDNELWCKICQLYIQNYVEIILDHVDEDVEHLQKLNKLSNLIKGEFITIDNYLTIAMEDKASCRTCDIKIPCFRDNIEAHIKGKKHTNNKLHLP